MVSSCKEWRRRRWRGVEVEEVKEVKEEEVGVEEER